MRQLLLGLSAVGALLLTFSCSSGDSGNGGPGHAGGTGGNSTSSYGGTAAGRSGNNAQAGRTTDGSAGDVAGGGSPSSAGTGIGGQLASGGETAAGGSPISGGSPSTGGSLNAGGSPSTGGGAGTGGSPPACTVDLSCDPPVLASTGDFAQDCVNRINQFRVGCHCLGPLQRWTEGEVCADSNAEYDQGTGQAHSGWGTFACEEDSGPLSSQYYGRATNECPSWNSASSIVSGCMKLMYGEGAIWAAKLGRNPTQADYSACEGNCYAENGHFIAMMKASHTHVACGIHEGGGGADVWAVQNFK